MKLFRLLILVLIFSSGSLFAGTGLYFGLGEHFPINSVLHYEYAPDIPYVIPDFGIAVDLGGSWKLCSDISYRRISHVKSSSGPVYSIQTPHQSGSDVEVVIVDGGILPAQLDVALNIIPLSIIANYYFSNDNTTVPFVGAGIAGYTVFSKISYVKTAENGQVLGNFSDWIFHNGIGLVANAGVNFMFANKSGLGISLRYDYTFIGSAKNGGLTDIGGIGLQLNYLYNFGGKK